MKKILTAFASTLLIAGCFGTGPSEELTDNAVDITDDLLFEEDSSEGKTTLSRESFVTISAEILCLPLNNPEVDPEIIETLAKEMLLQAGVTDEEFNEYQISIEANQDEKERIAEEIIGRMEDFCAVDEEPALIMEDEEISEGEDLVESGIIEPIEIGEVEISLEEEDIEGTESEEMVGDPIDEEEIEIPVS